MQILVSSISFILLLVLVVVPIFLYIKLKKLEWIKYHFLTYLILGSIISAGIIWSFSWWQDYSNQLLMGHYGYDFNALNDIDRFKNVDIENLDNVKRFETKSLGVGWPLKAILSFVLYSPYLLIVYLTAYLIERMKAKKSQSN